MKIIEHVSPGLDNLEARLGYHFRDRTLIERALTHRSWAHERVTAGEEKGARWMHNEAFEFVGDSVLGLIVAEALLAGHPQASEGELSRMKHGLVSTRTLARAAVRLGLGDFLRVGRGEEKTGGRRKRALLADVFEAVLAAIYLDGGLGAATDFARRAIGGELDAATPEAAAAADYKTLLQERVQATFRATPTYQLLRTEGPPHRRVFHVTVMWAGGREIAGEGASIKAAEIAAACLALEKLDEHECVAEDESEPQVNPQVSA